MTPIRSGSMRLAVTLVVALQSACAMQHPNLIWDSNSSQSRGPGPAKPLPESFGNGHETVAVVLYEDPAFDSAYVAIPSPEPKGAEGAGNATSDLWGACMSGLVALAPGTVLVVPFIMGVLLFAGCTVATPVVAIDGAVRGRAKTTGEIQLMKRGIGDTLRSVMDDDALVETVLRTAGDQTPHALRTWTYGPLRKRDLRSDYDAMAREGIDTALELEAVPVFALQRASDHPLALRIEVNARLTSVQDAAILYSGTFVFCCESHAASAWAAHGGQMLRAFFASAYPSLGERIAEEIFITYPLGEGRGTEHPVVFGLRPSYPPLKEGPGTIEIGSPRPTLAWEPLALERASNVTYELRVAQLREGELPRLAYAREGLIAPRHTLEVSLEEGAEYLWSVRARFTLDGRRRLTEWGYQASRGPRPSPEPDLFRRTAPVPNTVASPDGVVGSSYRFSVISASNAPRVTP